MNVRSILAKSVATRRARFIVLTAFVLLLLAGSRLVEQLRLTYAANNWERVSDAQCAEALAVAATRFGDEQRSVRRIATELSSHSAVLGYLTRSARDRQAMFARIAAVSRGQDVGIEVYDREGNLVGWEGPGTGQTSADVGAALSGTMTSRVTRTPIASQLLLAIPARDGQTVVGATLVRRTLESTAPLNNALLRRRGLSETLSEELGLPVEFVFPGHGESARDGRFCTAPLYGIDSSLIGSISVQKPVRSAYFETAGHQFQMVNAGLLALLLGLLAAAAASRIGRFESGLLRIAGITALIWILRFSLLMIDIPSGFSTNGVLDPALFASKFAGGLAKSIGELSITVFALTANILAIHGELTRGSARVMRVPLPWPVALLAAAVSTFLLYWVLRGFGAALKSGVADSTLIYFDPRVIVPSVELAMMILNFFLLGACLIVGAMGATLFIVRLGGFATMGRWPHAPWVMTALLFLTASVLFGVFQENPLMTTAYRCAFGAGILALTYWTVVVRLETRGIALKNLLAVLAGAALCMYPLLDQYAHERDRARIEIFAGDVLKPVDGWLKHIVEEGLQGFDDEAYRERLSEGFAGDVAGIAFRRWTTSLACNQGYDAMFTVSDPSGREASRFVIGSSVTAMTQADTLLPMGMEKAFRVRDVGIGVNALKVYAGSSPILGSDGTLLGFARVVVAAGQQALFRGETPTLLRGSSEGRLESFYRAITLSEYRDGILLTSSNPVVPIARTVPESVMDAFGDSTRMSCWADDRIGENLFETFFLRRAPGGSDLVAMGVRELGVTWHIVGIVKFVAAYAVMAMVVLLVARLIGWRRGERTRMTFRGRLLIALLITAILPLTIVALYTRIADRERETESIRRRLDEETQNVIYNITEHPEPGVTILGAPSDRFAAEELAADLETDFNLYTDRDLRVSSKQLLYDVGILEPRLSGNAYAKIILGGERFLTQTERVGAVEYSVGYRPILDAMENIIGVVSVPTLFHPEESEEQITRRNAFLLGAYAAVLLAILIIASQFANRIAAPVQRLTEATRRVARGDLDVQVPPAGAEGEIGDLIRSFDQMTHDLRRSRDELVKYERELAWKEMAKQVAHEIKNPLTPMRLSVQHLRRTYLDRAADFPAILDAVTKTVIEQIDALSRIASEFSHFARMPRRTLAPLALNDVVAEAVQLFSQESHVVFDMKTASGLPDVNADRDELRRALINVIRNGVQAMEGSGTVRVRTERQRDGVAVTITDHGKGVAEEIRSKLFEPNFSTKTDGMGLGLAIVRKTVEDLGGEVTLESAVGKGTTVTLWLPATGEGGKPRR